jgi:O-acetyl-ADP-ribose deacetylase (regulator of RNase III)
MIHYVKGNLLDSDCDYICHQVNCKGVMNSGIAKQIRERWPEVYDAYVEWHKSCSAERPATHPYQYMLGNILTVPISMEQSIINMAAQNRYGYDGIKYTSYDAFWLCLRHIADGVPKRCSIGFPKNIGCCRGGANWNIISTMIEEALGEDFEVYIYELEDA